MDYRLCEAAIIGDTQSLNEIMETDPLILDKFLAGCFHCKSPLHVATSSGQTLFVKELLRLKPKLSKVLDLQERSALHLASDEGHDEIVKELIDVSPEMCQVRDRDGNNPLHVAAIKGNVTVLELLVQTNPQAALVRVDRNETILHLCVKHNQLESLEQLLQMIKSKAFVNAKDNDGNTILHTAILEKRYQIARHVLRNGKIGVNEKNGSGETALDISFRDDIELDHERELDMLVQNQKESVYMAILLLRHKALRAKYVVPGEWFSKIKDSLMVVATLMATMAFQAGVSPPGGVWQDDSNGHTAGEAVMAYKYADSYASFIRCNMIGFIASLTTIFLLLTNGLFFLNKAATMGTLILTMCLAMVSMAITYALSNVVVTPKKERHSHSHGVVIAIIVWCSVMALLLLIHVVQSVVIAVQEVRTREKALVGILRSEQ